MNERFHYQRNKRLRAHLTTKALQTGTILETNDQRQHKLKVLPFFQNIFLLPKKVKVLHSIPPTSTANNAVSLSLKSERSMKDIDDVSSKDARKGSSTGVFSHSFSGSLRPRRRSCASSCPSPMRSSPSHSGVLCKMLWVQLVQQY